MPKPLKLKPAPAPQVIEELRPGQSIDLLKELHILTREGKLNQDTRRKLKQVYHLYQFIEPLLDEVHRRKPAPVLVDTEGRRHRLGVDAGTDEAQLQQLAGCGVLVEGYARGRRLEVDRYRVMDAGDGSAPFVGALQRRWMSSTRRNLAELQACFFKANAMRRSKC
jgi:hypothetical protein